ncbi:MAG: LysM peptidoglycan-binding domain-containing protein [Deltaproteobacteria bacterium]|jgi:membrane-bound lytic murein transglycosylase D|nr:LysM peptidoglycan-binding domain-containing protein [Deltaproteobacteria bacterium]
MSLLRRYNILVLITFILAISLVACSGGGKRGSVKNSGEFIKQYQLNKLPTFDIPVEINDRVVAWIKYFQGPGKRHFARYLRRSGRYIPMMHKILKEEGMPLDLVYISMIESGFNPHAYSHAHAVGLWQFIRATGGRYGLRVDGWTDERRDPYKATRAAAKHFKDLYRDHGDWYLAMVGYNAGPGRITKAIRISGSRDFWDMARHSRALRAETRDYVPKFIAAAIISKMPERFGFKSIDYEEPLEYENGVVDTQTDLQIIAECAGVSLDTVKNLNPHLHRGATPPVKNYKVHLPKGKKAIFQKRFAKIPKDEKIRIVQYRVKGGDTLSKIAGRYKVSVKALASANNIKSYKRLSKGKLLTIPVKGGKARAYSVASSGGYGKKTVYHKVRRGETAGAIARKHGVKLSQLKKWNGLNKRSTIRAGKKLKIYKKGAIARAPIRLTDTVSSTPSTALRPGNDVHYTLKKGETLGEVATRYGVSTKELMAWNKIKSSKKVRSGKKILIKGTGGESKETVEASSTEIDLVKLDEHMKRDDIDPVGTRSRRRGGGTKYHRVKRGETLGAIAGRYKVKTKELMAWNNIRNPKRVRVGRKLKIKGVAVSAKSSDVPAKVASVNSTYTYKMKSGDTLGGVANRHGVSTKQLMAWNNIKNAKRVRAGKTLKIKGKPVSNSSSVASVESDVETERPVGEVSPPKAVHSGDSGRFYTYKVKRGETLGGVANRNGVSTKQLMAWNKIKNPKRVRAGTKLKIKGSAVKNEPLEPVVTAEVNPRATKVSGYSTYTVKSGETLGGIANRHGVTVKQLMAWNKIRNPKLVKVGMKLKIKGGTSSVIVPKPVIVKKVTPEDVSPGTPVRLAQMPTAKKVSPEVVSVYSVQSGDTLWSIARKYKVTIAQLQKWNNLTDPSKVKPGVKLKVEN